MPLDDVSRPTAINDAATASIVKGMILRGDPQSDIAAWFGLNSARINELKKMSTTHARQFVEVPPAPSNALPPTGPYSYFTPRPGATLAEQTQQALAAMELKWTQALAELREELRGSANERRQTNEKLDSVLRQLAAFGRQAKLLEEPKTPMPKRQKPLEA
jgi:hypothetical protein